MNSENNNDLNVLLDQFLDGQMESQQAVVFASQIQQDENLQAEQLLQVKIDASLKRLFQFDGTRALATHADVLDADVLDADAPDLDSPKVHQTQSNGESATVSPQITTDRGDRATFLKIVLAASLLLLASLIAVNYSVDRTVPVAVHFQQQPLRDIFQQTVDRGFDPYYLCDDLDRFAAVFEKRQAVRLTLAEMPPGRKMLGLSYPGGISRNTTAMLCRADGQSVMVFVDVPDNEGDVELLQSALTADPDQTPCGRLNVFQERKYGLVFYEVTPLEQPTMIELFKRLP